MAHIGHEDSSESEIQRRRERLAACPRDHPQRGDACQALASSLHDSWNKTPSSTLLSEAIALYREGLALQPSTHPDGGKSCSHLANALLDQYRAEGGHHLLEETISLHRKALSLRSAGHPDRSYSCNGLARALLERYRMSGGPDVLDETIKLHREALSLQPRGHPDRAMYCNDLASTLHDRNQMKGSSGLLDEMIKLHREALALRPAEHPDHASSCNNLANALMDRYEVTGTTALLDEAITLYHNTRNLRPGAHPFRAMACSNLANALLHRYRATGVSAVLDDTITLCREALALRSAAHYGRAMSCTNLAGALLHRYQDTGDSALLDEVIKLHREALALRPGGHPSRGLSCYDLAGSLWQHCQQTQDQTVINEAVTLARQSATSWSPSDSWQPLLLLCSIHLEQWSPYFSISTATEHLLQAASSVPSNIAEFMREIQSRLDRMWLINVTWTPDTPHFMVEVYSKIIDRLSGMTGFAFDLTSQLTALRTARSFGSDACVAALLSGLPCQAIELIDHAHGLIWAQALHQRDPQLQDIPRSLASELEALLRGVSKPLDTHAPMTSDSIFGYLSPEDVRHEQNSRIQTILTDVRAMPGLERFMLGRSYTQLRETASEHPVVVLVSARGHSYALILRDSTQEAPDKIRLKLTSDRLSLLRDTAARVGLRQGVQGAATVQDLEITFERAMRMSRHKEVNPLATLADVWRDVVKPVFDHLQLQPATGRSRPRLHWCPTGDFAFLPIHAAGIYDGPEDNRVCCSDYVVSSYTSTLSALLNAQAKAPQTAPSRLQILAVAEDCVVAGRAMPSLWFVQQELKIVEDAARVSNHDCVIDIMAKHATVEGVTARIQTAHFVHLACHGTQDLVNALDSGFHLSDGNLTVSQLMSLNLDKAWFAYLSACETAKNDAQQPEQAVHLAAAMLHAGFKSVVATMWSMGDVDGPDMAQWFYEDLLSNEVIDADAVTYALDAAVQKLRAKIPLLPTRWAPYIHMGA